MHESDVCSSVEVCERKQKSEGHTQTKYNIEVNDPRNGAFISTAFAKQ